MPDANLMMEKRAHPRISIKVPIKYRIVDDQLEAQSIMERHKKVLSARTMDVSLGGMYIVTDDKLKQGVILRIDMSLNEKGQNLTAFAEVVWVNEAGGGIHFLTIKEEDMTALRVYLEKASS